MYVHGLLLFSSLSSKYVSNCRNILLDRFVNNQRCKIEESLGGSKKYLFQLMGSLSVVAFVKVGGVLFGVAVCLASYKVPFYRFSIWFLKLSGQSYAGCVPVVIILSSGVSL